MPRDYYAIVEHAARMTGLIKRVSIYDLRTLSESIRAAIEMEEEREQKPMEEVMPKQAE